VIHVVEYTPTIDNIIIDKPFSYTLFIRGVINLVVITKFILPNTCKVLATILLLKLTLNVQTLLGNISIGMSIPDQPLVMCSAFFKYLRKSGNTVGQYNMFYRVQEGL